MALTVIQSDLRGDAGFREVTGECVWVTVQTKVNQCTTWRKQGEEGGVCVWGGGMTAVV